MNNFLVIDVEADIYDQAPYNIGLVISNGKEVLETKSIWLSNHIRENLQATYSKENRDYFKNNREKFEIYNNDDDFAFDLFRLLAKFNISDLYAYNVKFDWRKLCKIVPEAELQSQLNPKDIMTAAFYEIMDNPAYLSFCRKNFYRTDKGYPSTSFETVYRYLTGDNSYNEVHRGLEDALDECDLLCRLNVKSKGGWKPIQPWRRLGKID